MDQGWHVYSTDLQEGGPTSATFNIDKIEGAELVGKLTPIGKEIKQMDPIFEMEVKSSKAQLNSHRKLSSLEATI